jgi:hypothetical protein
MMLLALLLQEMLWMLLLKELLLHAAAAGAACSGTVAAVTLARPLLASRPLLRLLGEVQGCCCPECCPPSRAAALSGMVTPKVTLQADATGKHRTMVRRPTPVTLSHNACCPLLLALRCIQTQRLLAPS